MGTSGSPWFRGLGRNHSENKHDEPKIPEKLLERIEATNEKALERLAFFSDAVFAVAMTLLSVSLLETAISEELHGTDFLKTMWFRALAYLASLFVIGSYWAAHRRLFEQLVYFHRGLVMQNLLFLLGITLLPIPAAAISTHSFIFVFGSPESSTGEWVSLLERPDAIEIAVNAIYAGVLAYTAFRFWLLWKYVWKDRQLQYLWYGQKWKYYGPLAKKHYRPDYGRRASNRLLVIAVVFLLTLVILILNLFLWRIRIVNFSAQVLWVLVLGNNIVAMSRQRHTIADTVGELYTIDMTPYAQKQKPTLE